MNDVTLVEALTIMQKDEATIKAQAQEIERLNAEIKKAFWWSAEFTHAVHDGKIQKAWEGYKVCDASRDRREQND